MNRDIKILTKILTKKLTKILPEILPAISKILQFNIPYIKIPVNIKFFHPFFVLNEKLAAMF